MKLSSTLAIFGLAAMAACSQLEPRNYDANDYYVLELDPSTSPDLVAARLGLRHEGQMTGFEGYHIFAGTKEPHDVVTPVLRQSRRRKRTLGGSDILEGVRFAQRQVPRKPWEKRSILPGGSHFPSDARRPENSQLLQKQRTVMGDLGITDPIFEDQWHLLNTVQPGHDLNVTGLWMEGITGHNSTVAIVDDGLDMYSDDLSPNYYAGGSYDFNDHHAEPKPMLADDRHGTRCAGEVAAAKNHVCGVGVAYDAKIAGLRILSKLISDADEAMAMIYDFQNNDIYSCSWGPPDDGRSMDAPGILIKRAMLKGIQEGRGGLGSIYVFASGNGANHDDNCNFDGYTNSIYSITVGAIDRTGQHPYYSERCSAQLVVTYSSGAGDSIHTTDVGKNSCYSGHGGTSAAAPLGAGVYALVLSVRPDLTWRDLQWLQMETAVPVNLETEDWQDTAIGKKFSHTFGYGKIDAYALVEAAKVWEKVKPQSWYFSSWVHVNQAIPEGRQGLAVEYEVTADELEKANLERVEHVTVTMNVMHTRRGDLSVDLISPEGVVSHISTARKHDDTVAGYDNWTFMTVAHWGESGVGKWKIIVRDEKPNEHRGTFVDFHLKLWGESIDPAKAEMLPMPNEDDDDDHAKVTSSTTTMAAATTTVATQSAAEQSDTAPAAVPTDQPGRPQIKPTSSGMAAAAGSGVAATATGLATQTAESTATDSNWISWLPSFGVSGKAQVWIYGALVLIVTFCVGLGIWLFMARRRKLRNSSRNDYEFELLEEDETQDLSAGEKGMGPGTKTRRTRGGELYDAFAGGSDDEDEFQEEYTDRDPLRRFELGRRRLSDDSLEVEQQHVVGDDEDSDDEEFDEKRHGQSSRAM